MGDRAAQEALRTRTLSGEADERAAAELSAPDFVGDRVGRYQLTEVLGVGGMGIVHAGYDPLLRRSVAVKLVRVRGRGPAREFRESRLLAEARTIAALSHPNVITVHHVGVEAGRLYIAMEHIDGLDLQRWVEARPRDWQEILELYRHAGRGVAAAHAHGLLHLDFKPDNVLVERGRGVDGLETPGRVVVTDFGLARWARALAAAEGDSSSQDPSGSPDAKRAGTPAFMAPEHALGMDVDARADQFSFCVSVFESLYGHLPFAGDSHRELIDAMLCERVEEPGPSVVPRWVYRALVRGLSADPESRYPRLDDLLAELEPQRRPGTRRVAWGAAGVGGAALLIAAAIPLSREASRPCDAERALEGIWDAAAQHQVAAALGSVSAAHAEETAQRVHAELERYARRWRDTYGQVCSEAGLPSSNDETMLCLHERRAELGALVDRLGRADARISVRGVSAIRMLSDSAECTESRNSQRVADASVDTELIDAEASFAVGSYELAIEQAAPIAGAALVEANAGRLARALLVTGRAELALGRFGDSAEHLEQSYFVALRSDVPNLAADAATVLVALRGRDLADFEGASQWARHAEAQLARADETDRREAALINNIAIVESENGRNEEAIELHQRALALREADDPEHLSVANSLNNLAVAHQAMGHIVEAHEAYARALTMRTRVLGGRHPDVAVSHNNLGAILGEAGRGEEAIVEYTAALEIWRETFGEDHHDVALALQNIAAMRHRSGYFEEARELMTQALEIFERVYGPHHPEVGQAARGLGMIEFDVGSLERSRQFAERSLEIFTETYGPAHPDVANTLTDLGGVARRAGNDDEAQEFFERALQTWRAAGQPDHPDSARALQGLGDLAFTQGRFADAGEHYAVELEVLEQGLGPVHPDLAFPLSTHAQTLLSAGDPEAAVPLIERAINLREAQGDRDTLLAYCRFVQAQVNWALGRDRPVARKQAIQARAALHAIGDANADMAAAIDEWLATRPRSR